VISGNTTVGVSSVGITVSRPEDGVNAVDISASIESRSVVGEGGRVANGDDRAVKGNLATKVDSAAINSQTIYKKKRMIMLEMDKLVRGTDVPDQKKSLEGTTINRELSVTTTWLVTVMEVPL